MFVLVPWRKQPKGDVSLFHREFDDLFNRFFRRDFRVSGDPLGKGLRFPTTDILEDNKKITLKAEIPGVEAKDVDVSLDGRRLTIKGEKKQEKEEEVGNYHRMESAYGYFSRTIELPAEVDSEKIEASYKRGVLKIVLKKTKGSQSKKIQVRSRS
jgi:HSP20 family protein